LPDPGIQLARSDVPEGVLRVEMSSKPSILPNSLPNIFLMSIKTDCKQKAFHFGKLIKSLLRHWKIKEPGSVLMSWG
jgi:hypothetical protein